MKHINDVLSLEVGMAKDKPRTVGNKSVSNCPFCQTEKLLSENKLIIQKDNMLWIENKFPTLKNTYQTLIIETNTCEEDLTTFSPDYAYSLFEFALDKRKKLLDSNEYKEVILFKNHGILSDSSIHHAHMQIVGLKENTYDKTKFENSLDGPVVFENIDVKVTVSRVPATEFYEFNVIWSKNSKSPAYAEWIQNIIKFLPTFKNGKFTSYNLAFHDNKESNFMKIVPRKPNSIYYLGFGLKQTPDDVFEVAKEIQSFFTK